MKAGPSKVIDVSPKQQVTVLAKRKRELMEQYASEELVAADREAKQLLNKR
mgnify:CR=1 FL=1